jgi:hypothetical protein
VLEKEHSPVRPVYAVQTRWGSWICAVEYLAEYMDVPTDFTTTLAETAKCVRDQCELLREHKAQLKAQAVFIVEHSEKIVAKLTKLEETSVPTANNIASKLEDLHKSSLSMAEQLGLTTGALIQLSCWGSFQRKTGSPALSCSSLPWQHDQSSCRLCWRSTPCPSPFLVTNCSRSSPVGRCNKGY